MLENIPASKGTYLIQFINDSFSTVTVGRFGQVELQPGYYFYIGSAFGPGGLRARLKHHAGISQRPHWHLDYIRPELELQEVWFSVDDIRHEHAWADSLYYTLKLKVPVKGLGSSDCKCESHFFYSKNKLQKPAIQKSLASPNLTSLEYVKVK